MCKWCEDCGFKLSSTKSAAVLFTRKHNPEPISLRLQDGTRLPLKNEYKYLGLTFQRNGSYSTHIQKVVAKCWARLNVIRMLKARAYARGVGVGVKKTLEFDILQNFITCAKEMNCFRILFAC